MRPSWGLSAFGIHREVKLGGLLLLFLLCGAAAKGPVEGVRPKGARPTVELAAASGSSVAEQRLVRYFFSAEAWGGLPFSDAEKQQVMVEAMMSGDLARAETEVTHLLSAPNARVRSFVAVFEVDGTVQPPLLRAGYELELLVPHSRDPLNVELINAETGVVNLVEVMPEGPS